MGSKFAKVERKYRELLHSYHQGSVDEDQFVWALGQLRVEDPQQHWWQIQGNGSWLRFDGREWLEATPPAPPPSPPRAALLPPRAKAVVAETLPPKPVVAPAVCAGCQNPIEASEEFCRHCGRPCATHPEVLPQVLPPTCPGCHQPVLPNAKFCGKCGQALGLTPVCPKCHAGYPAGARFCKICGEKLS